MPAPVRRRRERLAALLGRLRRLAGPDRGAADLLRQQKELQAYAASAFLALAAGLCVAALVIPGVVRPGGWHVAFLLLTCVLAVYALVAFRVPSLPEWMLVVSLLVVNGIVVLAAACQADRSSGRLIAALRLGGEELAVVAALGADDLVDVAERIRTQVELAAEPWAVTVSLGVAWEVPPDDDEGALALVWALVDRADDLMYAAKRAGRNRVVLAS